MSLQLTPQQAAAATAVMVLQRVTQLNTQVAGLLAKRPGGSG